MAFTLDEAFLPATLTAPPMSDEEFALFCAEHPDLFFETTAEGELIVMPASYSITGMRHMIIGKQLQSWAEIDGRGAVTDAASGFVLPNGARRSPDLAWTLKARIRALDSAMIERYWHLCPDFVIEVRSHTDKLKTLREKMLEWVENGASLAWLIDPDTRSVEIYRPGQRLEILGNLEVLAAEDPVSGFVLDLLPVWDPLKS